jgi:Domain of unknown function (DUF4258)
MPENYRLSRHAVEEMTRRQISLQLVQAVLDSPEQRIDGGAGKEILQSRFRAENGKIYLVRIVTATENDPRVVVTVYRTSKIEKYWRIA